MAPPSACGYMNMNIHESIEHLHMSPRLCGYLLPVCDFFFLDNSDVYYLPFTPDNFLY